MNFTDYEASHITPQKTLLKKLNEILKYLRQFNLEVFKIVDIPSTYNDSDFLTEELVAKIKNADFVRYKNMLYMKSSHSTYDSGYSDVFSSVFCTDDTVKLTGVEIYNSGLFYVYEREISE